MRDGTDLMNLSEKEQDASVLNVASYTTKTTETRTHTQKKKIKLTLQKMIKFPSDS